jgi:hypothetical protein
MPLPIPDLRSRVAGKIVEGLYVFGIRDRTSREGCHEAAEELPCRSPKFYPALNAVEISDIQEDGIEAVLTRRPKCYIGLKIARMEFLRSTTCSS